MKINWKRVLFCSALFYCWYGGPTLVQAVIDRHRCAEAVGNAEGELNGLDAVMVPGKISSMDQVLIQMRRVIRAEVTAARICQIE